MMVITIYPALAAISCSVHILPYLILTNFIMQADYYPPLGAKESELQNV
jgi:hypothetical protein